MATNSMQQSMLNKSRADKFLLVFDIPPILKEFNKKFNQNNLSIISDSVQFSIFGTAVPEITVPAVENRLIQVTRLFRTIKQILQFTVRMNLITIE